MSNPSGTEETSASGDVSTGESAEPQSFSDMMAAFNSFNESLVADVPAGASVSPASEGPSAPSIDSMTAGTPAASTASSSAATAKSTSMTAQSSAQVAQQTVQTTNMANGSQSTMDTEIRDTDLALLNSLLYQ